ncbi:MAG: hypothetical protein BGP24_07015 [Lysobacterales bacterium 69-70]|nr:hypothetical protein [Xanthomonadaceae bacterium]ODU32865.1 MAG: hypothetical protein ABS97_14240 [Xanthomonadaceae bacterium SCN 69-320]OJZ00487.1 MAG: hypothetical protein BGP24_07015 [Xanthomonadales bacterium 69-70]
MNPVSNEPKTTPPLLRSLHIAVYFAFVLAGIATVPALLQGGSSGMSCDPDDGFDNRLAEHGKHFGSQAFNDRKPLDQDVVPFDVIVFERSICFGDCPDYRMTLHRDGSAALVDHTQGHGGRFRGEISPATFARLAQLGQRARRSATKNNYMAGWTDDYWVTITLRGHADSWQVTDYGEVAPVEVWALERLLHSAYERIEWTPQ